MMESPPALVLEDVSKRFGRVQAVDHLSLQVEPGHLAGFLGPNGAGKSTALYMIPRLVRPTHGRISLFGVDIWIDEILERIGLADRQHDRVRVYSTGMKQRLGIGRAMLGRPRLLILDEPTNGMDPEGTHEVLSFLREKVRKDGLTVFISSHLMSEIEEFCDSVFVINRGRLVASGSVKELLKPHERIVRVTFQGKVPDRDFISRHEQIRKADPLTADTVEITLAQDDSAWLNQCLQ